MAGVSGSDGSVKAPARGTGPAPSAHELLKWVYLGRVALGIVMFVAASFSLNVVPPGTIVVLAVAALASVGVSVPAVWYTHIRRSHPGKTFLYGQALFDLTLVTTVVHVTGGSDSQFPALYVLIIAVSAVLMPLASSLLVTALASLLYVADIVIWQQVPLSIAVGLQIAVFVGVFLVTGLIASRVQTVGAERAELQQEVRRLRLEAADILRNIQSGVVTVDGRGELIYANAAALRLLHLEAADALGRSFGDALKGSSPDLAQAVLEAQAKRAGTLRAEALVRGPDRTFPIGVTAAALRTDTDETCSVTAIFTDISDQKRLEELRLRTERLEAVAEISASLAHEIRNPLASIRSSVEQLARSSRADADDRFLAGLVVRESDRLSNLLSQFLDFSRVRVTGCRRLDLATVAASAVDVVRKHPDCPSETVIEVSPGPVFVEGDEDLLHRIVVNLVLNAAQASRDGSCITVEAREAATTEVPREFLPDKAVLLRVSDNGPGIPPELRDRLFEPFVTGRTGGSGLGLAIVQRAVQAHRGVVLVDSDPGIGTAFTVLLPSTRSSEAAA